MIIKVVSSAATMELHGTLIFLLILCMATLASCARTTPNNITSDVFNVKSYGAVGDGESDDTNAFAKTWEAACGSTKKPVIQIPRGSIFLLKPISFQGPCKSFVSVTIDGIIVAPATLSGWPKVKNEDPWLSFRNLEGLTVGGNGVINGRGSSWWKVCAPQYNSKSAKKDCDRPSALGFYNCKNLLLNGLSHKSSPKNHISIAGCNNVTISNLQISAPATSPNTDGIDISASTNVHIKNCTMKTGDDCIAINRGCSSINIERVLCGPGHGISIGSLGADPATEETVEDVHVQNCIFNGTDNGARIKTWQGGKGYARKISFSNITLIDAGNPILIDQFYCPHGSCEPNKESTVKVSNVTFSGFKGTSKSREAISLKCSDSEGCTNVVLEHINITSSEGNKKAYADCKQAAGIAQDTIPAVECLKPQKN